MRRTKKPAEAAQTRKLTRELASVEKEFREGVATLRDLLAPAALRITPRFIELSGEYIATLFAFTYPRYLTSPWLAPIINLDTELDISLFMYPLDSATILKNLKKKVAQVQASITMGQEKGQARDPLLETAYQDIEELRDRLTQGTERFFRFGLYITVHAREKGELDDAVARIEALLEGKLIYVKPAIYQMEQGFISTLPLGHDVLQVGTNMNTSPLSTAFPFVSSDLTSNTGILYGINRHNNSLIIFDRFTLENANTVIFAKSGAGKSVRGSEPVLVREGGTVRLRPIGDVVEGLIEQHGITYADEELEGVAYPDVEVYSFNKELRGEWSRVTVAARKEAPRAYYTFRTRSGREITTTGDHNMLVLRNGTVQTARSADVNPGEYVPLPRVVTTNGDGDVRTLNLLTALEKRPQGIYVRGASRLLEKHRATLRTSSVDAKLDRYLDQYQQGRAIPLTYFRRILSILGLSPDDQALNSLRLCAKNSAGSLGIPAALPLTPEFFRLLGYIVAEGTVGKDVIVLSNTGDELRGDARAALTNLGIPCGSTDRSLIIGSRVFVNLLHALGCAGRAGTKRVPPIVFESPQHLQGAFLAGYFEGDGGVERSSIVSYTKSKRLIGDIAYLLYALGIVGRMSAMRKEAVGEAWARKRQYWKCTISGQENLRVFASSVGCISRRKRRSLDRVLQKEPNTNVDLIPSVGPIFEELVGLFGFQLHGIPEIPAWKHGARLPSRPALQRVVEELEARVRNFQDLERVLSVLSALPELDAVIAEGRTDKTLNQALWKTLGQSWRTAKTVGCSPYSRNAFKMIEVVRGASYDLGGVKRALSLGFRAVGVPVKYEEGHLQNALIARPRSNTAYRNVYCAARTVWKRYQDVRQNTLPRVRELIARLRRLAEAELFWDEIVDVETTKNRTDNYVYDLTVDNEVFLAGHGGMFVHNSYAVKLEILRSMMFGTDVIVIDPENEYRYLAQATGGTFLRISIASDHRINPFDLPPLREEDNPDDVLREQITHLTGLIALMADGLSAEEKSVVDEALWQTYALKDITATTREWSKEPPTLEDFHGILKDMEGGHDLALRLQQYVTGTFAGVFNRPTNIDMTTQLVVFNLRDMEEQLRSTAMYVVLAYIWKKIRATLKKRILVIDEAWVMMQHEESAQFLFGIAKRARKYYLGVTTITQDITDFLTSRYGKPIVTNSSIQILLRQSPAAIDLIADTFYLTEGEKYLLLESDVGEGLFFAGLKHVAIKIVASYAEDQIITSDPRQVLEIEAARKEIEAQTLGAATAR